MNAPAAPEPERHARQMRLPQVGAPGQRRLARASVAIVGLGATGSHLAQLLARAGVGRLTLIDRDVVELSNLPRQTLYVDADARAVRPKAEAAAAALLAIDPGLDVRPRVTDLVPDNCAELLDGADLVLDGTDNFPTRFVVNDWCVRQGTPFLYCGVVGTEGQTLLVRPGGPCLRCYVPEPPPPGALPTCDTAGVLGTAVALVTALAGTEALRVLLGAPPRPAGEVFVVDAWEGESRRVRLRREPACPCCVRGEYAFLQGGPAVVAVELCGRDAVQLPPEGPPPDLERLAESWRGLGTILTGRFLARIDLPERRVLVFADGRVIVGSTRDAALARSVRARLLGT